MNAFNFLHVSCAQLPAHVMARWLLFELQTVLPHVFYGCTVKGESPQDDTSSHEQGALCADMEGSYLCSFA